MLVLVYPLENEKMSEQTEQREDGLLVSEEFNREIEKYANQAGKPLKEFIEEAVENQLQELKKLYPDKTGKVEVEIPTGKLSLLQLTRNQGKEVNQLISQIITEKTAEGKDDPLTFKENGVTYERLSIDLPRTVVDFYRYMAHSKGKEDLMETLITFDLIDHLNAQIQGITPESLKEFFSLDAGLADMDNMKNRIFKD
jgi:predicted HicB family RNase H-like nuclease